MRVTSAPRVIALRGRRAVVRRVAESSSESADVETSPEESAAATELAEILEAIASERETLIETEMEQKQKETKALESQEDLELVATKQAQLAATAWEEHAEAEEATARRTAMSDEAFEAMGQAEMLVTELKAKMSILEIAAAAECKEDDIPCVDDAIEAAGGAENATEEPPAEKEKAPKVKKSEQWWVAEDLSIDDAVTVIAERLSEAEASFEKAKAEKVSREEKYAAAVQSAEDAKERAQAADQRAADAMTAVEEMMERVLEARVARSEAESAVAELDEKRAKLVKEEGLEEEETWVDTEIECDPEDEECLEALKQAVPADEMEIVVDAETLAKQKALEEEAAKEAARRRRRSRRSPRPPAPASSSRASSSPPRGTRRRAYPSPRASLSASGSSSACSTRPRFPCARLSPAPPRRSPPRWRAGTSPSSRRFPSRSVSSRSTRTKRRTRLVCSTRSSCCSPASSP